MFVRGQDLVTGAGFRGAAAATTDPGSTGLSQDLGMEGTMAGKEARNRADQHRDYCDLLFI